MWNLPRPALADALGYFDDVVDNTRGAQRTQDRRDLRALVVRRYALYEKHASAGTLRARFAALGPSLGASQRATLNGMYESRDGGACGRLKSAIRRGQTGPRSARCPYCAVGPPTQWDHVLPEAVAHFPELAVLNLNLVKTCGTCNGRKGTVWKPILHTYWDAIDGLPGCLNVALSVQGASVEATFTVERPANTSRDVDRVYRTLAAHCARLGLCDIWSSEAQLCIAEIRAELALGVEDGDDQADVERSLRRRARSLGRLYGPNYWEGILYAALADCAPFVELVCP